MERKIKIYRVRNTLSSQNISICLEYIFFKSIVAVSMCQANWNKFENKYNVLFFDQKGTYNDMR